jgi:hypothetical protein
MPAQLVAKKALHRRAVRECAGGHFVDNIWLLFFEPNIFLFGCLLFVALSAIILRQQKTPPNFGQLGGAERESASGLSNRILRAVGFAFKTPC